MPIPFESYPTLIGDRDWGANWGTALQDCDCPLAMQKPSHEASGATKIPADVNEIERLINEIERHSCWWWIRLAPFLWLARLPGS
jgi:hypothetical protein